MNLIKEGSKVTPIVSVIIVNYNGRELLRPCLESVFAQSMQDIEVIAVDNGSTDGSVGYLLKRISRMSMLFRSLQI